MKHKLPGMKVLQFEFAEPDFSMADIKSDTVCYTGTHDNDTVQGWLAGGAGDERSRQEVRETRERVLAATGGTQETAHLDLLRLALESAACCAIAPAQDLLGLDSTARLNQPGTAQGNWRWRLRPEILTVELQEQIRSMLRETDRNGFLQ
jgi:4-alpha-glucanotransferase